MYRWKEENMKVGGAQKEVIFLAKITWKMDKKSSDIFIMWKNV